MTDQPDVQSHGPGAPAPRRWWRRASYAPLTVLGVASVAALIAGASVSARLDQHPVPVPAEQSDSTDEVCRPAMEPATQEPWLEGDGSAERVWQENAAEVAQPYLVGPNGWIFWSDYIEQYASQAVGRDTLSESELNRWVDYYSSIRDGLAAEGVDFQIIVTPSTSSIYPEQLPTWMQELRGSTILDQFMAVEGDLPVIDLRASLIAEKTSDVNLFSWSNSHWTDFGGYVGWKQIARCVNAMNPEDPAMRVPAISGYEVVGDFNEWASFGVSSPGADWAVPRFSEPMQDVTFTDKDGITKTVPGDSVMDASWLPLQTTVAEPWTGKSALIIRDSMGGAISPYWGQAYSPTWQVGHDYTDFSAWPNYRDLVAQHSPDVVVLQLAERHLINTPPAGAAY
ncbi:alginate O-acetyltransferase AlgX-related protein [Microbacterium invictum]|uniref:AlgX/AlgJ SGNH hydrolase-like domain-containing protein n=1 Tax=Microbacterium invictum TaxID=515415 RepID=A0ABZ0V8N8_9MICO|nr:hypothetical protein [Microbacterium invictum]WQB69484.1 hypothetical protein T9R20_12350 [Microbacterium invictum]